MPTGATGMFRAWPQGEQRLRRGRGNPGSQWRQRPGTGRAMAGLGGASHPGQRGCLQGVGVGHCNVHCYSICKEASPPAETCLVTQAAVYSCVSFQRREMATASHPCPAWGLACCSRTSASELPSCTTAAHQRP